MSEYSTENGIDEFMRFCRNSIFEYTALFVCAIIYGILYEFLGKGIYSLYNRLLWLVPLFFGVVVFFLVAFASYKSKKPIDTNKMLPIILTVYKITIDCVCARFIIKGIGDVYGSPISKGVFFDYATLLGIIVIFVLSIITAASRKKS